MSAMPNEAKVNTVRVVPYKSEVPGAKRMTITPDIAMEWLRRSTRNRRLREKTVSRYAKAMSDGLWQVNGETIVICEDGSLNDGHHRLTACVKAGAPFESWVVFGVAKENFITVDTGRVRQAADAIEIEGSAAATLVGHDTKCLAAACLWVKRYRTRSMTSKALMTNQELVEFLGGEPELSKYVSHVCGHKKLRGLAPPALTSFCFYIFAGQDPDMAHIFFSALEDGLALSADEPVYLLRERLLRERQIKTNRVLPVYLAALFFKAWHFTRKGMKIKMLIWRQETEPFPEIE